MSAARLPVEQSFATGHQGMTLVLMVCSGWLWAGLYASSFSLTPVEVSATSSRAVRTALNQLRLGAGHYPMTAKSLQAAIRWLDRHGVAVRPVSPSTRAPRNLKGTKQ